MIMPTHMFLVLVLLLLYDEFQYGLSKAAVCACA